MNKKLRLFIIIIVCLAIVCASVAVGFVLKKPKKKSKASGEDISSSGISANSEEEDFDDEEIEDEEDEEDEEDWEDDYEDEWEEDWEDDYEDLEDGDTDDDDDDDVDDDNDDDEEEIEIWDLKVKNSEPPINTNYRGSGSIVYQMYTYMKYKNDFNEYTEQMAQEQFNRMQEIGIDYVRSDYNDWMTWNSNTNSFCDFNTDYYRAFIKEALELKKRKIDICVTTGWSLHGLIDNSSSIGSPHLFVAADPGTPSDPDKLNDDNQNGEQTMGNWNATLHNWSTWMEQSILRFRAEGVTNLTGLLLFTEPCKWHWEDGYRQYSFECETDCARELDYVLKKNSLRDKYQIIGPNQVIDYANVDDDVKLSALDYFLKNADDYVDVYTSHSYVRAEDATNNIYYDQSKLMFEPFMNYMKANNNKKPFWIDEWNASETGHTQLYYNCPWRGTQIGVCTAAIMNMGISNSILWTLYNHQWVNNTYSGGEFTDGIQMCGLAPALNLSAVPSTQYFGFTLLSKYLKDKSNVYACEFDEYGDVYISCAEGNDGEITVLVVNTNTSPSGFDLQFDKNLGGKKMYRHVYCPINARPYSDIQVIAADRVYNNVRNKLVDKLPAGALAIYTTVKG